MQSTIAVGIVCILSFEYCSMTVYKIVFLPINQIYITKVHLLCFDEVTFHRKKNKDQSQ